MRRRGLTLIELLVALTVAAIVSVAISGAFQTGLVEQVRQSEERTALQTRADFERQLTQIIRAMRLSAVTGSTTSFVIGTVGPLQSTATGANSPSGASTPGQANNSSPSGNSSVSPLSGQSGELSDTLTMTIQDQAPNESVVRSTDDFQTLNTNLGPIGGITEVGLTVNSQWNSDVKQGLFARVQRPADGDPTQGGTESVLEPDVKQIGFEFFDGLQWDPTWNTQTMTTPRLPAAVRVTYTLAGEADGVEHVLIVAVPLSDVTPTNPVAQGGTTSAGGTP